MRRVQRCLPCVAGLVACVAIAGPARAQSPQTATDVFPASAEVVRIDVVVTDKGGHAKAGLSREDFTVLEDGVPQTLVQFEAFSRQPAGTPPAPAPSPSVEVGAEEAPPPPLPRYLVLMIDDVHMGLGSLGQAKKALTRFLGEQVDPADRIALVTTSGARAHPEFTTDRAVLRQAVSRLTVREMQLEDMWPPHITEYQAELIELGDREALEVAVVEIQHEQPYVPDPEAAAKLKARRVLERSVYNARLTLEMVENATRSLARLRGRKVLFLLSDGFLTGLSAGGGLSYDIRRITDAGTRAGVVVYALDTGGLRALSPVGSRPMYLSRTWGAVVSMQSRSLEATRDAVNALAADTGGYLSHNSNDLQAGLRRMLEDTATYYVLAYTPTNTKRDGAFRRIEVRLPGQKGVKVRARRGYFASGGRSAETALDSPERPVANPVRFSADFVRLEGGVTELVVSGHVDVTMLPFLRERDRYRATIEIAATVLDDRGAVVTNLTPERAAMDLTEAEHAQLVKSGLAYQRMIPLKPARYRVRLVARGVAGRLGGAGQWVEVPDLATGHLSVSSVFLLKASATGAPTGSGDAPALQNAQALRRFRRDEDLYVQVYAYDPKRDPSGATRLVSQAEVLRGGVVLAAAAPELMVVGAPQGPPLPHTSRIKIHSFDPGPYELRVTVTDRNADETAVRLVGFTIE